MVLEGNKPSLKTYSALMVASGKRKDSRTVMGLLEEMEKLGLRPNIYIYTICIRVLGRPGKIDEVHSIFERMSVEGCGPDVATYTVLIDALCNVGKLDKAKELFRKMKASGHKPDVYTYNALIQGCSRSGNSDRAYAIYKKMVVGGCIPNSEKTEQLQRGQWLRAAILGANDGLLSTTSLIIGVGAAGKQDRWSILVTGIAGALAGACSMAVGEFVSVSTQRDIENSTNNNIIIVMPKTNGEEGEKVLLPNPYKAMAASAASFLCGSMPPLATALFITENKIRIIAIAVVASIALLIFGGFGAYLGGSPVKVSATRVLVGGWIAMAITYGLLKPFEQVHDSD